MKWQSNYFSYKTTNQEIASNYHNLFSRSRILHARQVSPIASDGYQTAFLWCV